MLQKLSFTTAYNRHGEQKFIVADHIKANDNKRSGLEKGERGVILGVYLNPEVNRVVLHVKVIDSPHSNMIDQEFYFYDIDAYRLAAK